MVTSADARHTPDVVIETERLLLRPLAMADLDEFVALHDDPEVTRFMRRLARPEAADRLRVIEREWHERGHGMFAVLDRASGCFLGRAGLKYWPQLIPRNKPSIPLARRLGMAPLRRDVLLGDPVVVYSLRRPG